MAQDRALPAAARFSRARFGARTRLIDRLVAVGATITEILGNNPNRVAWLIENRGVNNSAIGSTRDLTFANGLKLGADGGFASMDVQEDGEATTYAQFGISDVAAVNHRVLEIVTDREDVARS